MKYLKLLLNILIGLVGLFVILIIILLSAESHQIITKKNGNKITVVEIKKVFGRKISECAINSSGFYHGSSKMWDLSNNTLRSEGSFRNGFWDGGWRDYSRDGQLKMIREWNMGKLAKVFIPIGGTLKELPKNEWPKYVDVTQGRPALAHKSGFINILILFVIVLIFCIGAYLFLFYPTSGVHNPIEKDKFIFHKTGELVEYTFNPNLFKDYNVSIVSSKPFPTKEKFNWKIKYELIKDGKINKDGYLKELTRIYEGKDQKKAKIINFKSFGILRKWPGEVTLKMFVEKGDLAAAKYANQFKLNIGISWYK